MVLCVCLKMEREISQAKEKVNTRTEIFESN